MSFVRPRELVRFDPRQVTLFLQSGNVFELGGITNELILFLPTNLAILWSHLLCLSLSKLQTLEHSDKIEIDV